MQFFRRIIFITIMITLITATASASYRLVLQSGHDDLPVAVEWHEKTGTVVSVGDDGRLIVTHPADHRVIHRFRITGERVHNLSLNPASDRAAVVTSDGEDYSVSVWDWGDEKMVYDFNLESEPLFLSWSAGGRYLIVGNLGSPSVIVLEGRTGRRLSYLQRLPSLYNEGYIGSTETILMTYTSTGSIRYWDIRSSALKLSAETVSNLRGMTVLQTGSKTSLFGYRNETLYLINRQTGAILDQRDVPGLVDVSIDADSAELDALSSDLAGTSLYRFNAGDERFVPRNLGIDNLSMNAVPVHLDPTLKPVNVLRRNGTTYLMTDSGYLVSDADGIFARVIEDRLWRPDSLAFSGDSILMSNGSMIQRFTSLFFSEDGEGNIAELEGLFREERKVNTRATDTGISVLDEDRIVLWDRAGATSDNGYRILRFNTDSEEFHPVNGMIQKMEVLSGNRFLTVDRSGKVSIINSLDGSVLYSYSALGIMDATYSESGDYVLSGRSSAGRAGTPLERVDLQTGEAVPVGDGRFMVYRAVSVSGSCIPSE